jgi:hypothetical protein
MERSYIQLKGVIFVPGDVDHQDFIKSFYKMMDEQKWFYQGKSRKITEEDLDGEKRDSY